MKEIVSIGGISSSTSTYNSIVDEIISSACGNSKNIFIHLNLNNFSILKKDGRLLNRYGTQCRLFCEGIGLKSAVFLTGQGWNNDTNGTDLLPILFEHLANHKMKVFLFGASRQVIEKTVVNIKNSFPDVIISGYHHGYIEKSDYSSISRIITAASPDLLILAMGMQKESDFIFENYNNISAGAIWCVGGLFDFISGNLVRAPKIIRKLRLEWLFRFLLQPGAKFQRIVVTPFWFLKTVLNEHWKKK